MAFELKKMINNKLILGMIVLSVIITLYFSYENFRYIRHNIFNVKEEDGYGKYNKTYSEELLNELTEKADKANLKYMLVFDKYMGYVDLEEIYEKAGITKEEIETLSDEEREKIKNDAFYYMTLFNQAATCSESIKYRENVVINAKRLSNSKNAYISKVNKKIQHLYSKKINYTVSNEKITYFMINNMTIAQYSDYINIVLLLLAVCIVFLVEHRSNTFPMLYSSYWGRGRTYFNKMAVLTLLAVFMGSITSILTVIFGMDYGRFGEAMQKSVQCQQQFVASPYPLKVYQFLILTGILRIIGYVELTFLFSFIVVFFKKSIIPFIAGVLIGCGGYAMLDKICMKIKLLSMEGRSTGAVNGQYEFLRKFTPFAYIRDGIGYFTKYEPNNIMDIPVSTLTLSLVANLIWMIVFVFGGYVAYIQFFRKKGA